jgi:Xaa-Pro aminopeptidase
MERDNLPKIDGIKAVSYTELQNWVKKNDKIEETVKRLSQPGNSASSSAALVGAFLTKSKFKGTLALAGKIEAGFAIEFAQILSAFGSEFKVLLSSCASDILKVARSTKSDEEIELIAEAGKVTEGAIKKARDFLSTCHIKKGLVYNPENKKVTLGKVREIIESNLAAGGMDCPERPIVSHGAQSAVPHNTGTDSEVIRAGVSIVLDIFPRMTQNGYFFDTTRTICVGKASEELKTMYDHVLKAQKASIAMVSAGVVGSDVEKISLDLLEDWGHPTLRTDPGITKGFCHGLGHGLGLDLHEWPNVNSAWTKKLEKGSVVTVEPGVYYADKEIGIRIEDVIAIMSDGTVRNLCKGTKTLEIIVPEK